MQLLEQISKVKKLFGAAVAKEAPVTSSTGEGPEQRANWKLGMRQPANLLYGRQGSRQLGEAKKYEAAGNTYAAGRARREARASIAAGKQAANRLRQAIDAYHERRR